MRRRRLFHLGVGVLGLVCLVTACSSVQRAGSPAQKKAALQKAYDAVAAVNTAVKSNVSYEQFARLVPEASATLLRYSAPDEEARAIAAHLSAAVYSYQGAVRAWAAKYDECQDCAWRKFVSSHPRFASDPEADPDYAVSILCNEAAGELQTAATALASYTGR